MKHQERSKIGDVARWGHCVMPIIGRAALVAAAICTAATFAETPDAFLEYVESTGTQFVDIEIIGRTGTKIEADFRGLAPGSACLLGSHSTGPISWYKDGYGYACVGYKTGRDWGLGSPVYGDGNTSLVHLESIISPTGVTLDFAGNTSWYNDTFNPNKNMGSLGAFDTGINMYVFAKNQNGSAVNATKTKLYRLKIWQTATSSGEGEWTLVRDFRPCRRYDRGALWDAVSQKIFYSGSETDLTAGPVVTPTFERKAVDYVESTGSQYINTGVCPKYGTKTETVFAPMEQVGTFDVFLGSGPTGGYYYFGCLRSPWYIGAGCGTERAYADVPNWGFADSCGVFANANTSKGVKYTITTELSPEGDYNIDALGGRINGGYAYHKTRIVSQGDFLSSDYPLYVFASNNKGAIADPSKIRCYGVKIWQTNGVDGTYVLVRDLSPCQKDGKGALYDSVNDEILFPGAGVLLTSSSAVWNNTAGDNSFENPANWSTGVVPSDGDSVTVNVSGETTLVVTDVHTLCGLSVAGSGTLRFVDNGSLSYMRLNIASGTTVVRTGTAGLVDGGLTGAGTFVLDPGADNTVTMTKNNTDFTGEAIVKSGVVKFGDYQSFGKIGRNAFIRVYADAVLDENAQTFYPNWGVSLSKAILEEGAELRSNPGYGQVQYSALTTLNLEGNATIDTSYGNVTISERWNDHAVSLGLGEYTLTVKGDKTFGVSYCTISGTGTLDILSGATVESTHDWDDVDVSTTCADGTIRIREGGKWNLANYQNRVSKLSVKNLILDGSMTRAVNTYTLTVTGTISGKGTTPMLTMGEGAVFKPTGTGYLTITESLSGKMAIDASGLDLESSYDRIPLFKVGSAEMLQNIVVEFVEGTKPGGWVLVKTDDGLGYDLVRCGFSIIIR